MKILMPKQVILYSIFGWVVNELGRAQIYESENSIAILSSLSMFSFVVPASTGVEVREIKNAFCKKLFFVAGFAIGSPENFPVKSIRIATK